MVDWNAVFEKGAQFRVLNVLFLDSLLSETERITGKKARTAIDLGCGTGDAVVKIAQRGLMVVGIDASSVALEKARERLKENGIENTKLIEMDLNELDYDRKADFILCRLTYAFIEQKEKFLVAIKRILDDRGVFVLITPVLYPNVEYSKSDRPNIAVPFNETNVLLEKVFGKARVYHHEYFGDRGDTVTFFTQ